MLLEHMFIISDDTANVLTPVLCFTNAEVGRPTYQRIPIL